MERLRQPPRRGHTGFFVRLLCISWGWERAGFLSNCPISFLPFPGLVPVPSAFPNSFLDFLGVCALTLYNRFPQLSQTLSSPFYGWHFGSSCTGVIVLLCHLTSTGHELSTRNSASWFSPSRLLCRRINASYPLGRLWSSLSRLVDQAGCLTPLSGMMLITPPGVTVPFVPSSFFNCLTRNHTSKGKIVESSAS